MAHRLEVDCGYWYLGKKNGLGNQEPGIYVPPSKGMEPVLSLSLHPIWPYPLLSSSSAPCQRDALSEGVPPQNYRADFSEMGKCGNFSHNTPHESKIHIQILVEHPVLWASPDSLIWARKCCIMVPSTST